MSFDEMDSEPVDEDTAIESVLGENPRASELAGMISALEQKRRAMLSETKKSVMASERFKLEGKLAEIDMQLKVLRDEEAITTFVENSVRVTLSKPPVYRDEEE